MKFTQKLLHFPRLEIFFKKDTHMHTRKQFWNQGLNTSRAPMWSHLFGLLQALPLKLGRTSYQVLGLRLTPSCPAEMGAAEIVGDLGERGAICRQMNNRVSVNPGSRAGSPSSSLLYSLCFPVRLNPAKGVLILSPREEAKRGLLGPSVRRRVDMIYYCHLEEL